MLSRDIAVAIFFLNATISLFLFNMKNWEEGVN